jgi:hypothetical protein
MVQREIEVVVHRGAVELVPTEKIDAVEVSHQEQLLFEGAPCRLVNDMQAAASPILGG